MHRPVIADLIRNPEGRGLTGGYTRNSRRHSGLDPESTGRGTGIIGLLSPAQAGITLTFDSSPIKGEGDDADASLYGFPLSRGMTGRGFMGDDGRVSCSVDWMARSVIHIH